MNNPHRNKRYHDEGDDRSKRDHDEDDDGFLTLADRDGDSVFFIGPQPQQVIILDNDSELMGPDLEEKKKIQLELELSIKENIHEGEIEKLKRKHEVELERLKSKQQQENDDIRVRGGALPEPVHAAMVECVAHIASFLRNKDWRRLMISSKKLYVASKVLDPAWTDYGPVRVDHLTDVVVFDPHPQGSHNTQFDLGGGANFKQRYKFAMRDWSSIYIIDGQFVRTLEHRRTEFRRGRCPMGLGNTICFSSKYIVTGGADQRIKLWLNHGSYELYDDTLQFSGIIHDVAITFDSMFLAIRTSKTMKTSKTHNPDYDRGEEISIIKIGDGGQVINTITFGTLRFHGSMVFSETTDEIVFTGSRNVSPETLGTIELIFWKYKYKTPHPPLKKEGVNNIRQVTCSRYAEWNQSRYDCKKPRVSSIYVSNSGTTFALQYRDPDKIVVMRRNEDTSAKIHLVEVAVFDKYPETFGRKILFSPRRNNDIIVFSNNDGTYVAAIDVPKNCSKRRRDKLLPVAYKNQHRSHPLCILPDEKAMLVDIPNVDGSKALITSIPRVYQNYTEKTIVNTEITI